MPIVTLIVVLLVAWLALRFLFGVLRFLVVAAVVIGGAWYLWGQINKNKAR